MKNKTRRFVAVDVLLILGMILPFVAGLALKILTAVPSEGISITGAQIYFTVPLPLQEWPVTESQVNSLIVMIALGCLCLFLTHGIRAGVKTRRQLLAEWIVEKVQGMVVENMGEFFAGFGPFVTAILGLSGFSSLLALLGLYAPTSDLNVVAGWAVLVFVLITYYKAKAGPAVYVKSFANPVLMAPLNIISEIATPISMAFRHYGNVLSGAVISVLVAAGLQGASNLLFGFLPGFLGEIGWLRVGLPAILSIYFDVFSSLLQAYIFAMLTMLYISNGFPQDEYEKRKQRKLQKKRQAEQSSHG